MKQRSYALIAALMAALSRPAFSAEAQTSSPILQRLDQNKDSAVSRDEILAARAKLFRSNSTSTETVQSKKMKRIAP